jgi:hypothetical protein
MGISTLSMGLVGMVEGWVMNFSARLSDPSPSAFLESRSDGTGRMHFFKWQLQRRVSLQD